MSIVIDVGLLLQILGILVVLISQVRFVYRSRKEAGSLKKGFFWMLCSVRVKPEKPIREVSEEDLKEFQEWWALATYLSEDIRDTAFGLVLTFVGLLFEVFSITITVF